MTASLNKARKRRRFGFTLIELLVVVLILGILIAVAVPLYLSSVRNSGNQTVKANLRTIAQAAQAYRVRYGAYPGTLTVLMTANATTGYVPDLEQTPSGPRTTQYTLTGAATTCVVTANESGQDSFGTDGATDTATYNLQTGQFQLNGAPSASF
jgi:type II secretion system protein G